MFVLDRDDDSNKDYEGDDGDGEEGGKDDVGLLLDLLGSRHLTNRREAQHHNELEAGERNNLPMIHLLLMIDGRMYKRT